MDTLTHPTITNETSPHFAEALARLGARLIIQTAVEAEVTEFLGRARYQRAAHTQDARPGARNGYCPTTIKTTAGPVTIDRPKLRGTTECFASRRFGAGVTKTNALESLVIAGFVRGCRCVTWKPPSPTPSARRPR